MKTIRTVLVHAGFVAVLVACGLLTSCQYDDIPGYKISETGLARMVMSTAPQCSALAWNSMGELAACWTNGKMDLLDTVGKVKASITLPCTVENLIALPDGKGFFAMGKLPDTGVFEREAFILEEDLSKVRARWHFEEQPRTLLYLEGMDALVWVEYRSSTIMTRGLSADAPIKSHEFPVSFFDQIMPENGGYRIKASGERGGSWANYAFMTLDLRNDTIVKAFRHPYLVSEVWPVSSDGAAKTAWALWQPSQFEASSTIASGFASEYTFGEIELDSGNIVKKIAALHEPYRMALFKKPPSPVFHLPREGKFLELTSSGLEESKAVWSRYTAAQAVAVSPSGEQVAVGAFPDLIVFKADDETTLFRESPGRLLYASFVQILSFSSVITLAVFFFLLFLGHWGVRSAGRNVSPLAWKGNKLLLIFASIVIFLISIAEGIAMTSAGIAGETALVGYLFELAMFNWGTRPPNEAFKGKDMIRTGLYLLGVILVYGFIWYMGLDPDLDRNTGVSKTLVWSSGRQVIDTGAGGLIYPALMIANSLLLLILDRVVGALMNANRGQKP